MLFPQQLTIHSTESYRDGGTILVFASDEYGVLRRILMMQHAFRGCQIGCDELSSQLYLEAGRLYFDDQLIAVRSDEERAILALLRHSDIRADSAVIARVRRYRAIKHRPEGSDATRLYLTRAAAETIRMTINRIVEYVESQEYLDFIELSQEQRDSAPDDC